MPRDAYYSAPIAWAAWNGVVNGYSPTSFGPEDPITREQMAAILYRYVDYKQGDVSKRGNLTKFVDAGTISGYAWEPCPGPTARGCSRAREGGRLAPAARPPGQRWRPFSTGSAKLSCPDPSVPAG